MTLDKWIETFVTEKCLDREHVFNVEGPSGMNMIPLEVVIEHFHIAQEAEKKKIFDVCVQIDFSDGNVMHFFQHLATAIAK